MNIAIRVDLSSSSGTGHFYRSSLLAKKLFSYGHSVSFYLPNCDLEIDEFLDDHNDFLIVLDDFLHSTRNYDWLIIDSYIIDIDWETKARALTSRILKIDDLCQINTSANMIINTNLHISSKDYRLIANPDCKLLLGPKFFLFRDEFLLKKHTKNINPNYVHIFFGGNDHHQLTSHYSKLILQNFSSLKLCIVASKFYPDKQELHNLFTEYRDRVILHIDPSSMAETMTYCHLAFGAPGITTWERAYMSLPSAYISTHVSQHKILEELDKIKFCKYFGSYKDQNNELFLECFQSFYENITLQNKMKDLYKNLFDDLGGERVVNAMQDY